MHACLPTSTQHRGRYNNRNDTSRLMQNPLGAAFARKVLRCKARDEGRTLALFDEARNAAAEHFSCKPFGAVLGGARRSGRAKATAQRRRAIDRAPRPCFAPSTAPRIHLFVSNPSDR